MKGGATMRFTVTGRAICPRCEYSRRFSSEVDADTDEAAIQRFKDNHRYCFSCIRFGIQRELNFDSYIQAEERAST